MSRLTTSPVFCRLIQLEERVSACMLAAIVLLVFAAALMRTLGFPIVWSVDIAQLLFIWVCLLGANQALRQDNHVGIDYFLRRLPVRIQLAIDALSLTLMAAFLAVLVWFGVELSLLNPERTLGATHWPYALVTLAVPFGSVLMLVTTLWQLAHLLSVLLGVRPLDASVPYLQKYFGEGAFT